VSSCSTIILHYFVQYCIHSQKRPIFLWNDDQTYRIVGNKLKCSKVMTILLVSIFGICIGPSLCDAPKLKQKIAILKLHANNWRSNNCINTSLCFTPLICASHKISLLIIVLHKTQNNCPALLYLKIIRY
jgi:hypothetical protein